MVALAPLRLALSALGVALVACGTQAPAPDAVDAISVDGLMDHVRAIDVIGSEHDGTRAAGTPGYDASVDYVVEQLESAGLTLERQRFTIPYFEQISPATIEVESGDSIAGDALLRALLFSGSGTATGPLVEVDGGCMAADWDGVPTGAIAMVASGECFRRQQVELAQEADAVAVIAINPTWPRGEIRRPTLLDPDGITVPVLAAGSDAVDVLRDALEEAPPVAVTVSVETRVTQTETENVIATLGDAADTHVMVGAHLDSVLEGPGVNDNGSGVAAVLEIARLLAASNLTTGARFALWSAEELGTLGSQHYVESLGPAEIDRLEGYINLDMLGSPNHGRYVYDDSFAPEGSARIGEAIRDAFDAEGLTWAPIDLHGSSDHGPFMRAGVPAGGVFSGGPEPMSEEDAELFDGRAGDQLDPCYHLACDRLDNVDGTALAENASAVLAALIRLLAER